MIASILLKVMLHFCVIYVIPIVTLFNNRVVSLSLLLIDDGVFIYMYY